MLDLLLTAPEGAAEALDWTDFFVAETGAAAALAGLVVVAVSINVEKILASQRLVLRAAQTIGVFVNVLLIATFGLIPGLSHVVMGGLTVLTTGVNWIAAIRISIRTGIDPDRRRTSIQNYMVWHAAFIPMLIGGVLLMLGNPDGMYWISAGIAISFVVGVVNAWVLLVEILR